MVLSIIKRLPIAAALFVLSGCAYKYTTTFTVKNASSQTISVRVSEQGADNNGTIEFTLEPGRQRNIFTDSEKCPENYVPMDSYSDYTPLPPANDTKVLEIRVGGRKLSDDIRLRENWYYFSTDYMEKYTLSITDEIIDYYLGTE